MIDCRAAATYALTQVSDTIHLVLVLSFMSEEHAGDIVASVSDSYGGYTVKIVLLS